MPSNPTDPENSREWAAWQLARLHQTLMTQIANAHTATKHEAIGEMAQQARMCVAFITLLTEKAPTYEPKILEAVGDATSD